MPAKCACGCGLQVAFKGVFRKGHQPAGMSRDPAGQAKALNDKWSPIWNPIKNPIKNAKLQERARVDNEERIAKMAKPEGIVSEADADKLAEKLSTTVTHIEFNGATLEEMMGLDGKPPMAEGDAPVPTTDSVVQCAFYVGYTGRLIKAEYLGWLTTRGVAELEADGTIISGSEKRNRPVLVWSNGSTITATQAVQQVDFKYVEVYASTLMINARRVEKALQVRFQHLHLGVRLWRHPDKGAKYDRDDDAPKVHKVFVTYSTRVAQMLHESKIKLQH